MALIGLGLRGNRWGRFAGFASVTPALHTATMSDQADHSPTFDNPQLLWQLAKELVEEATYIRLAALHALEKQMGLEAGVTRVRQGALEGFFLQSLNYMDGRLWIRVELDPPLPERWGKTRHFYEDWEKVG